jgi:hypothetical protein
MKMGSYNIGGSVATTQETVVAFRLPEEAE